MRRAEPVVSAGPRHSSGAHLMHHERHWSFARSRAKACVRTSPIVAGLMARHGVPVVDAVPVDAGRLVPAARSAGGIGMASLVPDYVPTLGQLQARLRERRLRGLLPQHRDRGLRHPGGADRDHLARRLRLRPPRLPRPRLHLLRLPAAAHAGAADPDRAQPAHHRRSRPLRHAARRDGALLRLGLRHLPDAPDLPPDPARLRGGRRDRRRALVADRCGTCCCRWPSPA